MKVFVLVEEFFAYNDADGNPYESKRVVDVFEDRADAERARERGSKHSWHRGFEIEEKDTIPKIPRRFEAGKTYAMPWLSGAFLNVEILGRSETCVWLRDVEGSLTNRIIEVTEDGIETAKPFGDVLEELPAVIRADRFGSA